MRLSHKLNATLLVLMLALALAVAALVYVGFERTQDAARDNSREGLEDLGRQLVLQIAQAEAADGVLQLENASQVGHELARFFDSFQATASTDWDSSRLVRGAEGQLFDPTSGRVSDVFLPNHVTLNERVEEDIADSAALDSIFPAVFQRAPSQADSSDAYQAVAIYFHSVNDVVRYYPPIGIADILAPDIPLDEAVREAGPEENPLRDTVWSHPYQDEAGQGLLITALTPVYEGDVYRGVIGIDISIQYLAEKIDEVQPTEGSFAFYLGKDTGEVLPTRSFDQVNSALEADDGRFAAALERMKRGETAVERIQINGEPHFVAYAPFGPIGGSLAVAAPVSEITARAAAITASIDEEGDRTMLVLLSIIAVFFVCGLLAIKLVGRRVFLQPIEELVAGTRAVAAGDLTVSIPARGSDELGDLARSFNQMTSEMRMRRRALEAEIAERRLIEEDLEAQAREYRAVFNGTLDGLVISDAETGVVLATNPAFRAMHGWEDMTGIAPSEFLPSEGMRFFGEYLQAIRQGREFRGRTQTVRRDGSTIDVEVYGQGFSFQGKPAGLAVVRDVTEQTRAFQLLEERVAERTQELERRKSVAEALAELLAIVNSGRSLDDILDTIERQSNGLLGSDTSAIIIRLDDQDNLKIRASTGRESWYAVPDLPKDRSAVGLALRQRKPALIRDVRAAYHAEPEQGRDWPEYEDLGDRLLVTYLPETGDAERAEMQQRFAEFYPGFLAIPFVSKDQVFGALALSYREPRDFSEEEISLAVAFADQAAIAIENALLYRHSEERTRQLSALLEVSRNLSSTLALEPVLHAVIEQLRVVADYRRASVYLLEGESLRLLASRTNGEGITEAPSSYTIAVRDIEEIWRRVSAGEVVLIEDTHADTEINRQMRQRFGEHHQRATGNLHCQMSLPLSLSDRVIGMLVLTHEEPGFYKDQHVQLVSAIAAQAAIAIENARLYETAQQAATLEERQRLARELHDAVTQTLFSTALIAEAIPDLWQLNPDLALERLGDLRRLTRGALAEMRTLLVELRPGALTEMPLGDLLRQLAEAAEGRTRLQVTVDVNGSPLDLPSDVQVGLYRIAQESLSNTIKHAQAQHAQLILDYDSGDTISLSVRDDGRGFEIDSVRPGHLGLEIMRERARSIGAELLVSSSPGAGATITASWSRNGNGNHG